MSETLTSVIADRPPADGHNWENQCARCGSSAHYTECDQCEDGYSYHDCGEDTCCCLHPEPNVPCDQCSGMGGWWSCTSSAEWCEKHPRTGRDNVKRGQIEWFVVEEYR